MPVTKKEVIDILSEQYPENKIDLYKGQTKAGRRGWIAIIHADKRQKVYLATTLKRAKEILEQCKQ